MTKEIERLFAEVTTEKEVLVAILSSMMEGLIVLDPKARIVQKKGVKNMCGVNSKYSV